MEGEARRKGAFALHATQRVLNPFEGREAYYLLRVVQSCRVKDGG